MSKLVCRRCKVEVDHFEVVDYQTREGWCTESCWIEWGQEDEEKQLAEKERKRLGLPTNWTPNRR